MTVTDTYLPTARAQWGGKWRQVIADRERRKQVFHEFQESVPCHPDITFYESMSGAKMMDSPYALFRHDYHTDVARRVARLHVWSVRSKETVPPDLRDVDCVVTVKRHTPEYMYFLARASRIVGNSTLPEYFVRRPEQYYLNTWHGIGYKALGRNNSNLLGAGLSVANMLQATHVISPCRFMTDIHMHGFSMRNAYSGQFAEAGYPRVDAVFNTMREEKLRLLREMGCSDEKPIVTYAPTWRGDGFDADRLRDDLIRLSELHCSTVFLGHHMMLRHVDLSNLGDIAVPPAHLNTNELLSATDVLITDYSSIFFDFQVTGRPIIHYLYDYDEYVASRGLTLGIDELPGTVVTTSDGLFEAVKHELDRSRASSSSYVKHIERFNPYDQGVSTPCVANWFFWGDVSGVNPVQDINILPKTIFWAGRLGAVDATNAFFDEIEREVALGGTDVTLFVARAVRGNDAAMARVRDLAESISIVVRDDYTFGMTSLERAARSKEAGERSRLEAQAYDRIYSREYRRIFGDTRFDNVHVFSGLSFFWRRLAEEALK